MLLRFQRNHRRGVARGGACQPELFIWLNLRLVRTRVENRAICQAFAVTHGNHSRAAELLGVTRPTLYDRVEKLGIEVPDSEGPGQKPARGTAG